MYSHLRIGAMTKLLLIALLLAHSGKHLSLDAVLRLTRLLYSICSNATLSKLTGVFELVGFFPRNLSGNEEDSLITSLLYCRYWRKILTQRKSMPIRFLPGAQRKGLLFFADNNRTREEFQLGGIYSTCLLM
jgi:hypothetical protein